MHKLHLTRSISLRDIIRWTNRIVFAQHIQRQANNASYQTEQERFSIVIEAMDLFCAPIRSFHERLHMSKIIGPWSVQIKYCRTESYKPTLFADMHEIASKGKGIVTIGRVRLDVLNSNVAAEKAMNLCFNWSSI